MSRTEKRGTIITTLITAVTRVFVVHGNAIWNDEGFQCFPVRTYEQRLGVLEDRKTFFPLAQPDKNSEIAVSSIKNAFNAFFSSLETLRATSLMRDYNSLTPHTENSSFIFLRNSFLRDIEPFSWHPFYTRLFCNASLPVTDLYSIQRENLKAFFVDQEPTSPVVQKRTTDLNFIKLKAPEGELFLPTDQAIFALANTRYRNLTAAIFANPKSFGGGTNDKANIFYMNTAQEERTFLCFPGLFAKIEERGFVRKATYIDPKNEYAPFDKDTTSEQCALPRYRYCQDGIDKDLAPGSEIIRLEEDGSLGFGAAPQFSTFAVQNARMRFVSTTETFSEIRDKHWKTMCAYNPIKPTTVNLVFTAAPDLFPCRLPVNTFISLEYFEALVENLKTQMEALREIRSETFITGPIGCGIFGNDLRAVALAYAYVLMYHSPETLKNVAITDGNFYDLLKKVWTTIAEIQPSEGESEKALLGRIFEKTFPAEKMAERQLNFGQNNLCPPDIPLAVAFDTLARLKNKDEAKELLEARLEKILETPLMEDFEKLEDRSGKTLEKRLEEYVARSSK